MLSRSKIYDIVLSFDDTYYYKSLLNKYFKENEEFKTLLMQPHKQTNDLRGGHNKETILMNIQTVSSDGVMVRKLLRKV